MAENHVNDVEDEPRTDDDGVKSRSPKEEREPGNRVDLVIATAGVAGTLVAAASLAYQVWHR
ncbi:hypothetical protein [Catenulispora pinisilvae]|uniref:hypothetical protein n=1 Tax=Catenulispora pinisilvae TaxID=2705253 RepID=UPI001890DA42|nr:hypothetical protein [Catenulispora pinisilvae]